MARFTLCTSRAPTVSGAVTGLAGSAGLLFNPMVGTDIGPLFPPLALPEGLSFLTIGLCCERLLFLVSKLLLPITGVPRLNELCSGVCLVIIGSWLSLSVSGVTSLASFSDSARLVRLASSRANPEGRIQWGERD